MGPQTGTCVGAVTDDASRPAKDAPEMCPPLSPPTFQPPPVRVSGDRGVRAAKPAPPGKAEGRANQTRLDGRRFPSIHSSLSPVDRTLHHANRYAVVIGDPLLVRLTGSRA